MCRVSINMVEMLHFLLEKCHDLNQGDKTSIAKMTSLKKPFNI